jgi:hypothetical protein
MEWEERCGQIELCVTPHACELCNAVTVQPRPVSTPASCTVINNVFNNSDHIVSNDMKIGKKNELERMYKDLVVVYEEYSGISLEQLRKFMKTSILIPSFQTEI